MHNVVFAIHSHHQITGQKCNVHNFSRIILTLLGWCTLLKRVAKI
jgi:hypothetical protein